MQGNFRSAFVFLFVVTTLPISSLAKFQSLPDDDSREGFEKVPLIALLRGFRQELKNFTEPLPTDDQKKEFLALYSHLDPQREVPTQLLEKAVLYYAWNLPYITNKKYLTVIDYSKFSGHKRFFVINMEAGTVWSTRVAHGEGSDSDDDGFAEKFVNTVNSLSTSLGAYLTAETYTSDKNGLSMRLDGLSETNSKARERAVVFHGARYVKDTNVKPGRSWGCPAVPMDQRTMILSWIKDGSILYAGQ